MHGFGLLFGFACAVLVHTLCTTLVVKHVAYIWHHSLSFCLLGFGSHFLHTRRKARGISRLLVLLHGMSLTLTIRTASHLWSNHYHSESELSSSSSKNDISSNFVKVSLWSVADLLLYVSAT